MTVTDRPGPPHLATVTVDPRFRERRIAVRRDEGHRRLKRLVVLVGLAVVALGAVLVVRSPLLDVDEIAVGGVQRLDAEAVRDAAGISQGDPLLLADLGAATTAIEALPWVADAEVTRELWGTVHVSVREREAVAVVSGADRSVLVDAEGRVLEDAEPTAGTHVQVLSAAAPPAAGTTVPADLRTAIDLAGRLSTNPPGAVVAVHTDPTLRLELTEGGWVDLGDVTDLDAKVEAFRTLHARVDRSCLDTIDLTVPTHPVLTRQPC